MGINIVDGLFVFETIENLQHTASSRRRDFNGIDAGEPGTAEGFVPLEGPEVEPGVLNGVVEVPPPDQPGWYDVTWSGETSSGELVSTGIYFARLVAGEYSEVIKMLYLK